MDLTGIHNENEFYSQHYLTELLEKDLKEVWEGWRDRAKDEEAYTTPYDRLADLGDLYFQLETDHTDADTVEERIGLQREIAGPLLDLLGYELDPDVKTLDEDRIVPVLDEVEKPDGTPELWVLEAVIPPGSDERDPLNLHLQEEQYPGTFDAVRTLAGDESNTINDVANQIFARTNPPRWLIIIGFSQVILMDRGKWNEKRRLRFNVPDLLERSLADARKATAALLHRDNLCPDDGMPLLDDLDEQSNKHAEAVSEDLKYSIREAIERLGNEAIYHLKEVRKEKVYDGTIDPDQLTIECLRYMYRLLFLFYIESRPELGFAPMKSEEYRKGYSLESLRDLELKDLESPSSRNGYYLHESLETLFDIIYNGYPRRGEKVVRQQMYEGAEHHTFEITPLKSHLFDPERTPTLNKVKFRNHVLQDILEKMSLSRPGGSRKRRGRISYANLGINQLGAVYEALLSYTGFFAEEDLYEVKEADNDDKDDLEPAYFVTEDELEKYDEDEIVYDEDGYPRKHDRGKFIYRLSGRDREKSASYYTPQVLTECLVKYSLKELLEDKSADEILELTVCEPAMGSAAFLNEAVDQLADAYLERKQEETGETIPPDDYLHEKQKVKTHLADNNVFGVDLNPVATELGEVSLWLNTIYRQEDDNGQLRDTAYVPWFGMQLKTGNSLIGARREVFPSYLLEEGGSGKDSWLDEVPDRVSFDEERHEDTVYHFLLPDRDMAKYDDTEIKRLAGDRIERIDSWRSSFCRPFEHEDVEVLKALSDTVDDLWNRHVEQQRQIRETTTDEISIFGQDAPEAGRPTTTRWKDRKYEEAIRSRNVQNASPYRRLKFVMDYWCALWFWPIEEAGKLPSRSEFMLDLQTIINGGVVEVATDERGQRQMFPETVPEEQQSDLLDEFGFVNVDKLCNDLDRLQVVRDVRDRYKFHHWELEYADQYAENGGFDLVLGNPPWIKLEWERNEVARRLLKNPSQTKYNV